MEPIKINLTTPVNGRKTVNIVDMIEKKDELLIKLSGKECYDIHTGQELYFTKYIYENGRAFHTLIEKVTVIKEDEDHTIHTTLLPVNRVSLYNGNDCYYELNKENGDIEIYDTEPEANANKEDGDVVILRWRHIRVVSGTTTLDNGEEVPYSYYILKTRTDHRIHPQDLNDNQEIYIKNYMGEVIASYSGSSISIPMKREDRMATSADCITQISVDETCGKRFKEVVTYQYDYLPERISHNTIMISGFNPSIVNEMVYLETKFNPFYSYFINTDPETGEPLEYDEYGEVIKHCRLYKDSWWDEGYSVENAKKAGKIYVNEGQNGVTLSYDTYYWNVNVGLSSPVNESTLGSYDNFNTRFIEDIEQSLIPDIVDMERVKYSPMVFDSTKRDVVWHKWTSPNDDKYKEVYTNTWISPETTEDWAQVPVYSEASTASSINEVFLFDATNSDGYCLFREETDSYTKDVTTYIYKPTEEIIDDSLTVATSITMSFHFRERQKISGETEQDILLLRKRNTNLTSGNVYSDGWYINPDSGDTIWWNGLKSNSSTFPKDAFEDFMEKSGLTSDLIGYLNFTDNDIFYKKKKVSQSFVRLSFYNSPDPIEQKLLYYSTIFIDATELYGKYVKQLMYMEDNDLFNEKKNKDLNLNAAVVFCSGGTRLDTKMVITNEFDRTKSSEGFNLYLFAEDKNFNLENGEKTIYMKVEFNHAGNGKTLPMIMWPKVNGEYVPLTMDNFIENLYIPIKLTYINDRYVYYIPDAYKNENGNIDLVLFEPKIDYEDDVPE